MIQSVPEVIPIIGFSKFEQYDENMSAPDIKLSEAQLGILNAGRY
jgi:aryl-alcohol dehydrogenase-like predicted oxidoreductase